MENPRRELPDDDIVPRLLISLKRGVTLAVAGKPETEPGEKSQPIRVDFPEHHPAPMLYELIAIVRPGSLNEVREVARNAGIIVLRGGGVVRGYTNWGTFRLPKPTTKHQARYSQGQHFIMRFDSSGPIQDAIRRTLGLDPRMIRFSVVKLGDKLEEIKDVEGRVEWNNVRNLSESI